MVRRRTRCDGRRHPSRSSRFRRDKIARPCAPPCDGTEGLWGRAGVRGAGDAEFSGREAESAGWWRGACWQSADCEPSVSPPCSRSEWGGGPAEASQRRRMVEGCRTALPASTPPPPRRGARRSPSPSPPATGRRREAQALQEGGAIPPFGSVHPPGLRSDSHRRSGCGRPASGGGRRGCSRRRRRRCPGCRSRGG
jgi:hypothetical protein